MFFQACNPNVGNCSKPHSSSLALKNHLKNPQKKLMDIVQHVTEQLRFVGAAPSVQYSVIPPDLGPIRDEVEQRLKEEAEEQDNTARRLREEGMGIPMEF